MVCGARRAGALNVAATEITAVILAGGRAQRMQGRDKGLIELAGRPLATHVIAAIHDQVSEVLINANRNRERYAGLGCPVIADDTPDYLGPLAGMAAGMRAARTPYLLTVPCDGPLPCAQLAERLYTALKAAGARAAMAHDGKRCQPLYALVDCTLAARLRADVANGERRPQTWLLARGAVQVDFSDSPDMFLNLNDPAGLKRLEARMQSARAGTHCATPAPHP